MLAGALAGCCGGAAGILQRLVSSYCKEVGALAAALAGVGPLREALLAAAEVRRSCAWLMFCVAMFEHCVL